MDKFITVDDRKFQDLINGCDYKLLDVRRPDEFAEGHLPNAVNIDVEDPLFDEKVKNMFPPDSKLAVYCRSGRRSALASEKLVKDGYKGGVDLGGGILGWTGSVVR